MIKYSFWSNGAHALFHLVKVAMSATSSSIDLARRTKATHTRLEVHGTKKVSDTALRQLYSRLPIKAHNTRGQHNLVILLARRSTLSVRVMLASSWKFFGRSCQCGYCPIPRTRLFLISLASHRHLRTHSGAL